MKKQVFKTAYIVFSVIALLTLIALLFYILKPYFKTESKKSNHSSEIYTASTVSGQLPDNPIDLSDIQQRNSDVYAWITIPNTQIDYPIVQSYTEDDSFYLNHNIDKNYDQKGSIYTEKMNSLDFTDPNTVIYGHNMLDGSMFQNLHLFRDKDFFDKNKYIYIYTSGHIFKYEIFAAYKGDNKHILNTYNFNNKKVFSDYIENVKSPKSLEVNTRKVNITTDDKLITLSTCIGNESDYRYLVQGVLIDDTITK